MHCCTYSHISGSRYFVFTLHGLVVQVRAWMSRVAAACDPYYDDVHALLRKAAVAGKQQTEPVASKL